MSKEPITIEGLEKLKKELEQLKNIERPRVVAAIAEARSHGDLKENAEYHAAKEEQSQIEGRVLEISDTIARAEIIDISKIEKDNKIIFGSTISLIDLDTKKKIKYKIVGKDEADINENLIFFRSPIARALIGKEKNELITVKTPAGTRNFEIINVEYV